MKVRALRMGDIEKLCEIHSKVGGQDDFPDITRLRSMVVITEDNGNIITAGGIELIAEGVCITDTHLSPIVRGPALIELLRRLTETTRDLRKDVLHSFITPSETAWIRALQNHGFEQSQQTMLFKRV
jgi:hypothetical protein